MQGSFVVCADSGTRVLLPVKGFVEGVVFSKVLEVLFKVSVEGPIIVYLAKGCFSYYPLSSQEVIK